jgi:hypothetical protein
LAKAEAVTPKAEGEVNPYDVFHYFFLRRYLKTNKSNGLNEFFFFSLRCIVVNAIVYFFRYCTVTYDYESEKKRED